VYKENFFSENSLSLSLSLSLNLFLSCGTILQLKELRHAVDIFESNFPYVINQLRNITSSLQQIMSLLKNLLVPLIMPTKTLSNVLDFLAVLQQGNRKRQRSRHIVPPTRFVGASSIAEVRTETTPSTRHGQNFV
jgi:hypothetical protein